MERSSFRCKFVSFLLISSFIYSFFLLDFNLSFKSLRRYEKKLNDNGINIFYLINVHEFFERIFELIVNILFFSKWLLNLSKFSFIFLCLLVCFFQGLSQSEYIIFSIFKFLFIGLKLSFYECIWLSWISSLIELRFESFIFLNETRSVFFNFFLELSDLV